MYIFCYNNIYHCFFYCNFFNLASNTSFTSKGLSLTFTKKGSFSSSAAEGLCLGSGRRQRPIKSPILRSMSSYLAKSFCSSWRKLNMTGKLLLLGQFYSCFRLEIHQEYQLSRTSKIKARFRTYFQLWKGVYLWKEKQTHNLVTKYLLFMCNNVSQKIFQELDILKYKHWSCISYKVCRII